MKKFFIFIFLITAIFAANNTKNISIKRKNFFPEPWMLLNIAIYEYDKEKMRKILEKYTGKLPHRDEINSLYILQKYDESKENSFKYLDIYKDDFLLYKQYLDIIHENSSNLKLYSNYIDRGGNLKYFENKIDYIREVSQKKYILFNFSLTNFKSYKRDELKNVKDRYQTIEFGYKQFTNRGFIKIMSGLNKGIKNYFSFSLQYLNRCTDKIESSLNLNIGKKADESIYTLLAGKKNSLEIFLTYKFDNKKYIEAQIEKTFYKDQENVNIGDKNQIQFTFINKIRVSYPDFSFKSYLKKSNYNKKDITNLIQHISNYENPQFLPDTNSEVGVGFFFGYDHKYRYTRYWKPFVDITISYNTLTKSGYSADLGIGGPLFRKDNISFSFSYSSEFSGINRAFLKSSIYYIYFF